VLGLEEFRPGVCPRRGFDRGLVLGVFVLRYIYLNEEGVLTDNHINKRLNENIGKM